MTWDKEQIMRTAGSYWQSCALLAGVQLNLFSIVGNEAKTVEQICQKAQGDLRGTTMLLDALVAMGILEKQQEFYRNTQAASQYLDDQSEQYQGFILKHFAALAPKWGNLNEAVLSGKPMEHERDEAERENFLMGMFNLASQIAPIVAEQVSLQGKKHLLDLGGGPGTYAIYFCQKNPSLKATVFDLPTTKAFAVKTIEKFQLSERIDFAAGNYLEDDFPTGYDIAWLSHILHMESPKNCYKLVEKTVAGLAEGGIVMIHEFILNNTGTSPVFPALFALNMLINTEQGRSYREEQLRDMLQKAGLKNIERISFTGPNDSGIIIGKKLEK